jgi:chromate transporter
MQVLPGPEAHELCVHMGMVARGRIGGVLAGIGFMLPGFVLMLLCAWAYAALIAGNAQLAGVLLGVQAAVLAIILRAVHRIGTHILMDLALVGLAILGFLGFLGTLAGVPFWVLLGAAGVAYAFFRRPAAIWASVLLVALAAWGATPAPGVPESVALSRAGATAGVVALFVAGLKGGLLTFGGAYTAIPYVRGDTVGRGWLSDGAFLDGVALAGLLPAPLVIFATFAGYLAGGWAGAFAITAGMFLPAFAFSLLLRTAGGLGRQPAPPPRARRRRRNGGGHYCRHLRGTRHQHARPGAPAVAGRGNLHRGGARQLAVEGPLASARTRHLRRRSRLARLFLRGRRMLRRQEAIEFPAEMA